MLLFHINTLNYNFLNMFTFFVLKHWLDWLSKMSYFLYMYVSFLFRPNFVPVLFTASWVSCMCTFATWYDGSTSNIQWKFLNVQNLNPIPAQNSSDCY